VDFLQILLEDDWTPGGALDDWDVEKQGTRVLMATESGGGLAKRTLVRVWGDPALLPAAITDNRVVTNAPARQGPP
jgi:hypothetical protein